MANRVNHVVLVHRGFVDGSGWMNALGGTITAPAWKTKPSWYLLVADDKMIPLPAQQFMRERAGATSTEVPGSHAIYVSNPSAVAALIKTAATSPQLAA